MGRQAEMLASLSLKDGWRIDGRGEEYPWECSLPPRESSRDQSWYLAGRRFGAPTLYVPDVGHSDKQVVFGVLATFIALEEHECLEWFKKNGWPIVDPHEEVGWEFTARRRTIYNKLYQEVVYRS